jgi:hypothetical protein
MYILYWNITLFTGILIGFGYARQRYIKVINEMTDKNKQLIDRVKKSESIVLHDILQLSPDDMDLLREKMKEPKFKEIR